MVSKSKKHHKYNKGGNPGFPTETKFPEILGLPAKDFIGSRTKGILYRLLKTGLADDEESRYVKIISFTRNKDPIVERFERYIRNKKENDPFWNRIVSQILEQRIGITIADKDSQSECHFFPHCIVVNNMTFKQIDNENEFVYYGFATQVNDGVSKESVEQAGGGKISDNDRDIEEAQREENERKEEEQFLSKLIEKGDFSKESLDKQLLERDRERKRESNISSQNETSNNYSKKKRGGVTDNKTYHRFIEWKQKKKTEPTLNNFGDVFQTICSEIDNTFMKRRSLEVTVECGKNFRKIINFDTFNEETKLSPKQGEKISPGDVDALLRARHKEKANTYSSNGKKESLQEFVQQKMLPHKKELSEYFSKDDITIRFYHRRNYLEYERRFHWVTTQQDSMYTSDHANVAQMATQKDRCYQISVVINKYLEDYSVLWVKPISKEQLQAKEKQFMQNKEVIETLFFPQLAYPEDELLGNMSSSSSSENPEEMKETEKPKAENDKIRKKFVEIVEKIPTVHIVSMLFMSIMRNNRNKMSSTLIKESSVEINSIKFKIMFETVISNIFSEAMNTGQFHFNTNNEFIHLLITASQKILCLSYGDQRKTGISRKEKGSIRNVMIIDSRNVNMRHEKFYTSNPIKNITGKEQAGLKIIKENNDSHTYPSDLFKDSFINIFRPSDTKGNLVIGIINKIRLYYKSCIHIYNLLKRKDVDEFFIWMNMRPHHLWDRIRNRVIQLHGWSFLSIIKPELRKNFLEKLFFEQLSNASKTIFKKDDKILITSVTGQEKQLEDELRTKKIEEYSAQAPDLASFVSTIMSYHMKIEGIKGESITRQLTFNNAVMSGFTKSIQLGHTVTKATSIEETKTEDMLKELDKEKSLRDDLSTLMKKHNVYDMSYMASISKQTGRQMFMFLQFIQNNGCLDFSGDLQTNYTQVLEFIRMYQYNLDTFFKSGQSVSSASFIKVQKKIFTFEQYLIIDSTIIRRLENTNGFRTAYQYMSLEQPIPYCKIYEREQMAIYVFLPSYLYMTREMRAIMSIMSDTSFDKIMNANIQFKAEVTKEEKKSSGDEEDKLIQGILLMMKRELLQNSETNLFIIRVGQTYWLFGHWQRRYILYNLGKTVRRDQLQLKMIVEENLDFHLTQERKKFDPNYRQPNKKQRLMNYLDDKIYKSYEELESNLIELREKVENKIKKNKTGAVAIDIEARKEKPLTPKEREEREMYRPEEPSTRNQPNRETISYSKFVVTQFVIHIQLISKKMDQPLTWRQQFTGDKIYETYKQNASTATMIIIFQDLYTFMPGMYNHVMTLMNERLEKCEGGLMGMGAGGQFGELMPIFTPTVLTEKHIKLFVLDRQDTQEVDYEEDERNFLFEITKFGKTEVYDENGKTTGWLESTKKHVSDKANWAYDKATFGFSKTGGTFNPFGKEEGTCNISKKYLFQIVWENINEVVGFIDDREMIHDVEFEKMSWISYKWRQSMVDKLETHEFGWKSLLGAGIVAGVLGATIQTYFGNSTLSAIQNALGMYGGDKFAVSYATSLAAPTSLLSPLSSLLTAPLSWMSSTTIALVTNFCSIITPTGLAAISGWIKLIWGYLTGPAFLGFLFGAFAVAYMSSNKSTGEMLESFSTNSIWNSIKNFLKPLITCFSQWFLDEVRVYRLKPEFMHNGRVYKLEFDIVVDKNTQRVLSCYGVNKHKYDKGGDLSIRYIKDKKKIEALTKKTKKRSHTGKRRKSSRRIRTKRRESGRRDDGQRRRDERRRHRHDRHRSGGGKTVKHTNQHKIKQSIKNKSKKTLTKQLSPKYNKKYTMRTEM